MGSLSILLLLVLVNVAVSQWGPQGGGWMPPQGPPGPWGGGWQGPGGGPNNWYGNQWGNWGRGGGRGGRGGNRGGDWDYDGDFGRGGNRGGGRRDGNQNQGPSVAIYKNNTFYRHKDSICMQSQSRLSYILHSAMQANITLKKGTLVKQCDVDTQGMNSNPATNRGTKKRGIFQEI
ncbi:hypothetical protein ANCCEY_01662 [Ancylostoma ceylanicum]|uniref:Uncharacterized protein n=1 Tax=Ancylostoma ceylanicum TaxID=53326 RepID=A0A0D6M520_9BILA|nr:hypothetical protein ANCCEY_01662 [Ancylostoma ceylanicum]